MAITGAHVLLHSPEADGLREVLRDAFGWDHVDAGHGWLIFSLPPAEVAVHPSDQPFHALSLMCDDLDATVAELEAKGITFDAETHTERWGITRNMRLPGNLEVLLYQPTHPTAI